MLTLKALCQQIKHDYIGKDVAFTGAAIDTRRLLPGDLFVACNGQHVDGHDFIANAEEKGAAALLLNHKVRSHLPQIIVNNTADALASIAKQHRDQFSIPMIAITGSCGKTSTKNMIAHLLTHHGPTFATPGNYNNHLGVPLSLCRLTTEHQYAVLELGTSGPGEIASLCQLVSPTLSLITNIRAQHLEGLGTINDVAIEKSAIFACLNQPDHLALINIDDPHILAMTKTVACPHLSYSTKSCADIYATNINMNAKQGLQARLIVNGTEHNLSVPLIGQHVINNLVAAIGVCHALNIDINTLTEAYQSLSPVKGRFFPYTLKQGALIIDDTYNASAASVKSAIATLVKYPGQRIFVMSNMSELGHEAQHYHAQMGRLIQKSHLDHVLFTGDKSLLASSLKFCQDKAKYFDSKQQLTDHLKTIITDKTMVVVKGSRTNKMENIINALLAHDLNLSTP